VIPTIFYILNVFLSCNIYKNPSKPLHRIYIAILITYIIWASV